MGEKVQHPDEGYVKELVGFLEKFVNHIMKTDTPKDVLSHPPTKIEMLSALVAMGQLSRHELMDYGINVDIGIIDKSTGSKIGDSAAEAEKVTVTTSWFDTMEKSLLTEINQAAHANGGEVPLSMWEVQRMIGRLHLLQDIKEKVLV